MEKRTQIICIHESRKKDGVDPVFAQSFIRAYKPKWVRPIGSNSIRCVPCNNKVELLERFPTELKLCMRQGADTTLVVLADVDDDCESSAELKRKYEQVAKAAGVDDQALEQVLFIFPKDRIENWIEYLNTGKTNEAVEGTRVKSMEEVKMAAGELARKCREGKNSDGFPPSLKWSCANWRRLVGRMN